MMKLLAHHVLAMAMVISAGVLGQWRLGRTLLALMLSTYGGYLSSAVKDSTCHPLGKPIIWRWTCGKG